MIMITSHTRTQHSAIFFYVKKRCIASSSFTFKINFIQVYSLSSSWKLKGLCKKDILVKTTIDV